jgi:hypothetical protein
LKQNLKTGGGSKKTPPMTQTRAGGGTPKILTNLSHHFHDWID